MKNVTITLSNDLVQVLDSLSENCNLSRYAFTKEALLEKIERQTKINPEKQEKESSEKEVNAKTKENPTSEPPFLW